MKKIKKGDPVVVIAGKHKGKVSTVMKVADQKVYLDGVNVAKKAVKGEWHKDKILPLDISNVMYYLKDKKQAVRVGFEVDKKKKKIRKAKKVNVVL